MFKQIDRYLGRTILFGTLLALLIFVSIESILSFINDAERIGKEEFTLFHAFLAFFFAIPQRVYELTPSSLLVGSLVGLGGLGAHGELVGMRAGGVSKRRITWSALSIGVVIIFGCVLVGELVAPTSEGYVRSLHKSQELNKISLRTKTGLWTKDGDRYINIKQVFPDNRITGVSVYELNDQFKLQRITRAQSAVYEHGHWILNGVQHTAISPKGVKVERTQIEEWPRLISPDLFDVVTVAPEYMGAQTLTKYIQYLKENNLDSKRYELAFFSRIAVPLSGLVMLLLAIPFAFRFSRGGGLGQHLFIGAAIALSFFLLNRVVSNASVVYDIPPAVGAFLPMTLVGIAALIALRRLA